jgi:uncharacterized SAM-binding protein YcdF (DUF218 family)
MRQILARPEVLLAAATAALAWLALLALGLLVPLAEWALPLTLAAGVLGGVVAAVRIRWLRRLFWIGALAVCACFILVAFTPLVTAVLPTRGLVRRDPFPTTPVDAVIVLSGGVTVDSLLGTQAVDRLLTGLELVRDSVAPMLVVTRARRGSDGVSADPDQRRLRALVARPFAMLIVDSVRTTRDEAVNAARLLLPRGADTIALVTSPMHTGRACAAFERAGFRVRCVPAVSRDYTLRPDGSAGRLALFREWIYERMAWLKYRQRGWV